MAIKIWKTFRKSSHPNMHYGDYIHEIWNCVWLKMRLKLKHAHPIRITQTPSFVFYLVFGLDHIHYVHHLVPNQLVHLHHGDYLHEIWKCFHWIWLKKWAKNMCIAIFYGQCSVVAALVPGYPRSGWKAMDRKKEKKIIKVNVNNGQPHLRTPPWVAHSILLGQNIVCRTTLHF